MKIVTIIGARPQFIKAAPVSRAIQDYNLLTNKLKINEILVHTGQHYDQNMSQIFFDELKLPKPHYNLEVGSGHHGQMTATMLERIEKVLMDELPDIILVYGDTNSTLAGALAASKLHIPVAHVEAGLRSFNRSMPEEINRVLTDHVSSILFCPTDTAVINLKNEGITQGVFNVGDVMYDAFLYNKNLANEKSNILERLELNKGNYCLATVHREENTEKHKRLSDIFSAFDQLATRHCQFVIPLHPRTSKEIQRQRWSKRLNPFVRVIPPVGYLDMIVLESNAKVILTDSGGIQKEAYFSKVPCVTLRNETEWVETVKAGWNILSGTKPERIVKCVRHALPGDNALSFGKGESAKKIVQHLTNYELNHIRANNLTK